LYPDDPRYPLPCTHCQGPDLALAVRLLNPSDGSAPTAGQRVAPLVSGSSRLKRFIPVFPTTMGCYSTLPVGRAAEGFLPVPATLSCVVNQVQRGNAWDQRSRKAIAMQSLRVQGMLVGFSTPDLAVPVQFAVSTVVKLYIIYDKRFGLRSVMPAWTDMFEWNVGGQFDNMCFQSNDTLDEFDIIYVHTMEVGGAQWVDSVLGGSVRGFDLSRNRCAFDFTVPLADRVTRWADSLAFDVGFVGMTQGPLYLYACCDVVTGNPNTPGLLLSWCLEFTDVESRNKKARFGSPASGAFAPPDK